MHFYLNFPLVAGYVSMAIVTCLGMLQLAAVRGGYVGLSLFTTERKRGVRIGAGLTVGALLAYVTFAPEIRTPGPAGTEVAAMFSLCALVALIITLIGADRRMRRQQAVNRPASSGEPITLGNLTATLCPSGTSLPNPAPVVVLLPDPAGFVVAPAALVEALRQAGIAVLALDAQAVTESNDPLSRRTLLGHLSIAAAQLSRPGEARVDEERIGLLGLGLGGDAVLRAAVADPQIRAALAVSPVGDAPLQQTDSGLHWLRELSYQQIWRWRQHWPARQQAVRDLQMTRPAGDGFSASGAVLQASSGAPTIRMERQGVELLIVPSWRHFTLLEDERAVEQAVLWLQNKLE